MFFYGQLEMLQFDSTTYASELSQALRNTMRRAAFAFYKASKPLVTVVTGFASAGLDNLAEGSGNVPTTRLENLEKTLKGALKKKIIGFRVTKKIKDKLLAGAKRYQKALKKYNKLKDLLRKHKEKVGNLAKVRSTISKLRSGIGKVRESATIAAGRQTVKLIKERDAKYADFLKRVKQLKDNPRMDIKEGTKYHPTLPRVKKLINAINAERRHQDSLAKRNKRIDKDFSEVQDPTDVRDFLRNLGQQRRGAESKAKGKRSKHFWYYHGDGTKVPKIPTNAKRFATDPDKILNETSINITIGGGNNKKEISVITNIQFNYEVFIRYWPLGDVIGNGLNVPPWGAFASGRQAFTDYINKNLAKEMPRITDYLLKTTLKLDKNAVGQTRYGG